MNGPAQNGSEPGPDDLMKVSFEMKRSELPGFMEMKREWNDKGVYEQRVAQRQADQDIALKSLRKLVNAALINCYGTSGGTAAAQILASVYNGTRVKVGLYGALGSLDGGMFEAVLHVLRLHFNGQREIHTYFNPGMPLHDVRFGVDGNDVFEKIIRVYKLEKRRRKS